MSWGVATQNGVSVSLTSIVSLSAGVTEFSPADLFTGGVQGAWYDPSDINTYMAGLGPELVTNGDFSNGTTGWSSTGSSVLSVVSGALRVENGAAVTGGTTQTINTVAGRWYTFTYYVNPATAGNVTVRVRDAVSLTALQSVSQTVAGVYTYSFAAIGSTTQVQSINGASTLGVYHEIDSISVKEVTTIANATMFQDSAGTTPVTAVEQPVGLMLDKSQGLVLGPELVTNGNNETALFSFGTLVNQDTVARASAPSGGFAASFTSSTSTSVAHRSYDSSQSLLAGKNYRFTGRVYVPTGGVSTFRLFDNDDGSWFGVAITAKDQWVSFDVIRTAKASKWSLGIGNNVADVVTSGQISFWLDNLSVRELPGNHASQATAASRPVLRARYNLLTYSEQFDNAAWTKIFATISANATTAPDGTTTADKVVLNTTSSSAHGFYVTGITVAPSKNYTLQIYAKADEYDGLYMAFGQPPRGSAVFNLTTGAKGSTSGTVASTVSSVGNGWWRISITVPTDAADTSAYVRIYGGPFAQDNGLGEFNSFAGNGTSGIFVWGADLRTGSSAGTYQRIAAATDYATAGFLPYLYFVTDDSFGTNSINFTATDKMSVCAGVTKLSDAAAQIVCELSATSSTGNNGSFAIISALSPSNYAFYLYGNALASRTATTYASPVTNVVSVKYDISQSTVPNEIAPQINGAVPTLADAGGAGTGNFGNYPLYIGRRNNATLPFEGRIYGLIVCGKALSASELSATESWMNSRTGAY